MTQPEQTLMAAFRQAKTSLHTALCDNIDTVSHLFVNIYIYICIYGKKTVAILLPLLLPPLPIKPVAIQALQELVGATNLYVRTAERENKIDVALLRSIALWITHVCLHVEMRTKMLKA